MTTKTQLRKAALALPEVEETSHEGMQAYRVEGEVFAALSGDGTAQLYMSSANVERYINRFPQTSPVKRAGKTVGLAVPLGQINGMHLNSLVKAAWFDNAPERLVESARLAQGSEAPAGPDALPKSIGKPATRALLLAGITTLSQVAERSEEELLALHGVGPRAIGLLRKALEAKGKGFGEEG